MRQRACQLLLICTFLPLCWLLLQAVHELGHVVGGLATGGAVRKVVLHPLAISRTDVSGSRSPLAVVWAGPVAGVLFPLAIFAAAHLVGSRGEYLARFFAGACLVGNGSYLGVGWLGRVGDAGALLSLGAPVWTLWLFGAICVPFGFYLWNGQGPNFGLGPKSKPVDYAAAYLTTAVLILIVVLEAALSGRM